MIGHNLKVECGARSHVGAVRDINEDCLVAVPEHGVWAVADGMGGHDHGDRASQEVIARIGAAATDGAMAEAVAALEEAILAANSALHAEASAEGTQMGSTVVALLVRDGRFAVLWAGDSRAYLFRGGSLLKLTRDHTQVQLLLDRGLLEPEQVADHPMAHILSRAVGVEPELLLDGVTDATRAGDIFLLCSDGLFNLLDEAEMAAWLQAGDLDAGLDSMIETCLARGAPDNVSLIVVRMQEVTLLRPGRPLPLPVEG